MEDLETHANAALRGLFQQGAVDPEKSDRFI